MRIDVALGRRLCVVATASLLSLTALTACGEGEGSPPSTGDAPPAPTPTPPPPPVAEIPYTSPFLADSLWPVYHGNSYSTASVVTAGPGDVESVEVVRALTESGDDPFVSPWTVVGEAYSDGSQPLWATPNDGVAKYAILNDRLEAIDFLALDRRNLDVDWALLARRGGDVVVTERKENRLAIVGDIVEDDVFSPIDVKARIDVDEAVYGPLLSHHTLAPDGTLIAITQANKLIAVDLEAGEVIAQFDFPDASGASFQNSFPIDEEGRIFVAAQSLAVAVQWDGEVFTQLWTAEYDMRGPGCEGVPPNRTRIEEILAVSRGEPCTGTGTTPTLIGDHETGVFVIVDGHQPQNNLLALWRDAPPDGWEPLDDPNDPMAQLDPRVAAIFPLPYSTPDGDGFTAQNSPAAHDNGVIIAQWAGFNPGFDAPKGVQRVDWNPGTRKLELAWANPEIAFNGVPLIACETPDTCRTYGSGRYGDRYEYVSLDFETGVETGRVLLGVTDEVLDQGNGHAVADDGSIVTAGKDKLLRLR